MQDSTKGILILILVIVALGFVFYVNINDSFSSLTEPVEGRLGNLCDSYEDCLEFCHNNRGQCDDYCYANRLNTLCSRLFGEQNEA